MTGDFPTRCAQIGGILLLALAALATTAEAAPPGPVPPGGHLNITEVLVNEGPPDSLTINGQNLDFGGTLVDTLNGFGA